MELLKMYKEIKQKEEEYEKIEENRQFEYELRRLVSAIIIGEEYILTSNEKLFTELGEKHKKEKTMDFGMFSHRSGWKLKITEKLVKKVEEYLNK